MWKEPVAVREEKVERFDVCFQGANEALVRDHGLMTECRMKDIVLLAGIENEGGPDDRQE